MTCPVCGQTVAIDDYGCFYPHLGVDEAANISCPGSGTRVDHENPPEPKPVGPPLDEEVPK